MRLAFCLFKYFPYGGLQRDFLRIAKECLKRGHMVDVFTMKWEGQYEAGMTIRTFPIKGLQNHTRRQNFVNRIRLSLQQGKYDLIVGFNKMPGLDVYYAADTCYQAKARKLHGWFYRLSRRYRQAVAFEKAVFATESDTEILLISKMQQAEFIQYYHTPLRRFHLLPPGIDRDRIAPDNAAEIRASVRSTYGIGEDEFLLLAVGSGFKTKGLDRTLRAYAALPADLQKKTRIIVIGKDNPEPFQRKATRLRISERVMFLGGRDDVPSFLLAADILMHPAYNENTGTVLIEAIVAGLPILTTDVCGYAEYVRKAEAGRIIASPFQQQQLNQALAIMLLSTERAVWHQNGLNYAKTADIYSMPERAANFIESLRR
jgi:UDP-glucose:(heptosyl)LPS alpha-1,3-glucosyltransferase